MRNRVIFKLATSASALCLSTGIAFADQVFTDDVIVDGSLCVGQDCVNGESFGFDTIRLKENNLRIGFNDTSNSASFPSNDWEITINDSGNGGANYFGITDSTSGRVPFRVESSAPSNALYVDDSGRVGFGTSSPLTTLQAVTGNTPTLRLEQDGSNGFTAQIWDIASNETNFFIRDASNGSTLPFRIRPGAPSSAIDIAGDGDVGIGTGTPAAPLHVRSTDGTTKLLVEEASSTVGARVLGEFKNNGIAILSLTSTQGGADHTWNIQNRGAQNSNELRIANSGGAAGDELVLSQAGDLTIAGSLFSGGTQCGTGCDRVFSSDYDLLSIQEHADLMWEASYLPNVGPTPEGSQINITDKLGRMLNELEHAHIYIAELHGRIEVLEGTIGTTK